MELRTDELKAMIVPSAQCVPTNPREYAKTLQKLSERIPVSEIAQRLGQTVQWVREKMDNVHDCGQTT